MKYQIGVVGLAVMGTGLALNLAEHGFSVAGYNREDEGTRRFEDLGRRAGYRVAGFDGYRALCASLERPRKILVMVKAGRPVDMVLEALSEYLQPGDVVIDGGNSHYRDTQRRQEYCNAKGICLVGMGVSGGEEGARRGPAMMPGGDRAAYDLVAPFLTAIAARAGDDPCCRYIGPEGAGHFVKMVHNGIEYADMQLICEAYYAMKCILDMPAREIADMFEAWNQGELSSYLIEITAEILRVRDPQTGGALVDAVEGVAGSKGTGMWTVQEALSLGAPVPTIAQAVFSRDLSARTQARAAAARRYPTAREQFSGDRAALLDDLQKALYAGKICAYAQGFDLLRTASAAYGWDLDLGAVALLFRGGCIIRAAFLDRVARALREKSAPENLLLADCFAPTLGAYQGAWRRAAALLAARGVSAPAMAASLGYFDAMRDSQGPLNLLQAQRDRFGSHTYRRVDMPGSFHSDWK